jgi:hypothetical protein
MPPPPPPPKRSIHPEKELCAHTRHQTVARTDAQHTNVASRSFRDGLNHARDVGAHGMPERGMLPAHNSRGFDSRLIGPTFAKAVLGNGLVAIGSGVVASQLASTFGLVAPFDAVRRPVPVQMLAG